MKLPIDSEQKQTIRRAVAKAAASLIAFCVLLACIPAPMLIWMLASGASLESKVPEDMLWLVLVGGSVGAGAAYLIYRWILVKVGGFDSYEVGRRWHGKGTNT